MDTLERARTLGGGRRARRRDGVEQPVLDGLERPEQELDDERRRKHLGVLEVEPDRRKRPPQHLVQVLPIFSLPRRAGLRLLNPRNDVFATLSRRARDESPEK